MHVNADGEQQQEHEDGQGKEFAKAKDGEAQETNEEQLLRDKPSRIENLRAIPWVFSWAQIRVGFPGVFGFGTALDFAIREYGLENIRDLLNRKVFFQAMVGDVEMVLGKSEMGLGQQYSGLAPEGKRYFFDQIREEFELAGSRILELKQLDQLLDDQRVLQRNIRLRNPYVDPLHLLQVDLLQRWRAGGREDDDLLHSLKGTVKGTALGIQNTG